MTDRLRITEIFHSLQGESSFVGIPTVFVRLTGCPLRCVYCDTEYAFSGGRWWELSEVEHAIKNYRCGFVTVTGGEPLAQKNCLLLLTRLCDRGLKVSLETGGALDIAAVDHRVIKVVDLKTPGSGEFLKNHYQNIEHLQSQDQVKFVICDREDYEWAKSTMEKYSLTQHCDVLLSPSYNVLKARQLADWILQDGLEVRFQVQLHKYLWGEEPGR